MKKRLIAGLLVCIMTVSTVFTHFPAVVKAEEAIETVEEAVENEEEAEMVTETGEETDEEKVAVEEATEIEDATTETGAVPEPYYEFTFGNKGDGSGKDRTVKNTGTKEGTNVRIGGHQTKTNIMWDEERKSKVLNLTGGGLDQGYLTLPSDMYKEVTNAGFAFSFWIQVDKDADQYSRIISSTISEPNSKGSPYTEAEFTVVAGADYDTSITLSNYTSSSDSRSRFKWDPRLLKTEWQYVTISVDPQSYDIYLNGNPIGKDSTPSNLTTILSKLFENNCEELNKYAYNVIGRSVYTDPDIKAKLDEFRFYNTALTSAQAKVIYDSYQVNNTLPTPVYEFTFEENTITGNTVNNSERATGNGVATLEGEEPGFEDDNSDRGSRVLNLPGGSATSGYLTLPEDLFENVSGEDGFTVSLWVKALTDSNYNAWQGNHYQRIFESSSTPLGETEKGNTNNWEDPEFTFVIGGVDETDNRYNSAINTADKTKSRLEWDSAIGDGKWGYVTVSVSKDTYTVYRNGEKINVTDLTGNLSNVLSKYFAEISNFTHNALGQSIYTSDANAKAQYDDFRFYDVALTEAQALSIYYDEYEKELNAPGIYDAEPTLNFDITDSLGTMKHRSTGFLYGVSESNVPSMDLISAIQPKMIVQKAADGKQHPSGDAYRLTSYMEESGLENLQIYLQDYYLEWPYESNGIEDYKKIVQEVVTKMTAGKSEEEKAFYSYVLFNEPDQIWYSNNGGKLTEFCNDWLTIYNTVKAIDPNAKVAGPNFASYHHNAYETFFAFCKENDCLPEMITWHDLQKDKLTNFESEYNRINGLIDIYYAESDIEPILFVNEIANFEDVGAPGPLVNWLAIYEEKDVYAALPYWGLANSLNELAADANKPNSAWWVYKWYTDMQGYKVKMTKENQGSKARGDILYGLTSVDEDNDTVATLFGGHEGVSVVNLNNLAEIDSFADAANAHVKIYRTRYSGHHGFADEPPVIYEGNLPIQNGTLQFAIEDCELLDAYYAVITPAADDSLVTIGEYTRNWTATYEAEDAEVLGGAKVYQRTNGSDLARSGRAEVGNIKTAADGVEYTVSVPQDGTYKLRTYYSVPAPNVNALTLEEDPNGQNRAIGRVMKNSLVVDGNDSEAQILNYKSTVKTGYYNYETVYLDLTAGEHTITISHYPTDVTVYASQDKIDLTYESEMNEGVNVPAANIQLEEVLWGSEIVDGISGYTMDQKATGYMGGGYVTGKGDIAFNVVVAEDGLYDTTVRYQAPQNGTLSIKKKAMDYAEDAKATTPVSLYQLPLGEITVGTTEQWVETECDKVFLTAGANTIIIHSANTISLDQITFKKDREITLANTLTIPAESGELSGKAVSEMNTYADGNRVISGIGGGSRDNKLQITFDAPEAGNYKLSMYYTNNEPAPVMKRQNGTNYVHPYNTDLVERYAQIAVNGNDPETVYFRNTLSWDVFNNVVIDVVLQKGTNTITFYNDNSYKFSELVDDYAPKFSKFEIIPATTASDAAVSIDKNYLYRAIMERKSYSKGEYTADSYAAYTNAIQEAEQLYRSSGAVTEEAIQAAINGIDMASSNLISTVELIRQIEKAKKYHTNEANDAATSFAPLLEAIERAEVIYQKRNATKQEIGDASGYIISTMDMRVQIVKAKSYHSMEADYTVTSFAALVEAIEKAEGVYLKKDATAGEFDAEVEALETAINDLSPVYARINHKNGTVTSSSSNPATNPEQAWDGDPSTHPDLVNASGGWDSSAAWTQIAFEEEVRINRLVFAPRSGYASRLNNGFFQISGDGEEWTTIHTIRNAGDGYTTLDFDEEYVCRFVRYHAPANAYLNIAVIDLYTSVLDADGLSKMKEDRDRFVAEMEDKDLDGITVTEDFQLPLITLTNESTVTWSSNSEAITIDESGNAAITRQKVDTEVTLSAVVTYGEVKSIHTYTVTVKGIKLAEIRLKSLPAKMAYEIGEAFNTAGMAVEAVYDDGSVEGIPIQDCTVTGFHAATAGKKTVTVTYQSKTVSFEVEVKAAPKTVQAITTSQSAYTKTFGDKAFSLGAKTSGNGNLSYHSNAAAVCTVTNGKVTIKGAGKATITITAAETNTYKKAEKTVTITVNPKSTTISVNKASHTKVFGNKAFSLGAKTDGDGKISYTSSNSKICSVNSKGKVTIKNTGKVTVTIKAAKTKNCKQATRKVTITVKPKKVSIGKATSPKARTLKITWKKDGKASGYQVIIATNKKFTKNKKTANITKNSTVSRSFQKLKKGTTYYVRVRAYKKAGTAKIYGAYSNRRTVRVK